MDYKASVDKWGQYVIEKDIVIPESCGYEIFIYLKPVSIVSKILAFFNKYTMSSVNIEVIDLNTEYYESLKPTRVYNTNVLRGVFFEKKGKKTLKILLKPLNVKDYDIRFKIERVYS